MKVIPLTQGKEALVDDEDYESLSRFKWFYADGYAVRNIPHPDDSTRQTRERMHRKIMGLAFKDPTQADHRSVNKLDNRRNNLRLCDFFGNAQNKLKRSDNTSGFKGVYFRKDTGKWKAQIAVDGGAQKSLGQFDTPELAHEFYCLAADMLHGDFARHA